MTMKIWMLTGCLVLGAMTTTPACGPFFSDAHNGQDENPLLCKDLETICWLLFRPGEVRPVKKPAMKPEDQDPPAKQDQRVPPVGDAEYQAAIAPALVGIKQDNARIDHPLAAIQRIQDWITKHPGHPLIPEAEGWQAFVLFHHREVTWGQDRDGLYAAVRIWQRHLTDPAYRSGFDAAVGSLRFAYRELRPDMPKWMIADPRHAIAAVWHAQTDHADQEEILQIAKLSNLDRAPQTTALAGLNGGVLLAMAEIWLRAGKPADALQLAKLASTKGEVVARLLTAKLLAEAGDPASAQPYLDGLTMDERYRDVLIIIGGAWEKRRSWEEALRAYIIANSTIDIRILTDGEMPLEDLARIIADPRPLISRFYKNYSENWDDDPRVAGYDWRKELGCRLARRLIRHDRVTEALPYLDGDHRIQAERLIHLQMELTNASPVQRPERLFELAKWWYEQGPRLVVNDKYWHQWVASRYFQTSKTDRIAEWPALPEARARIETEIEAMTVYLRAYPLFLEVADRHPDHPLAPQALYQAALCRYWPCGTMPRLRSQDDYWKERVQREGFWKQGDALLRRLAERYPQHTLAKDAKVAKALERSKPKVKSPDDAITPKAADGTDGAEGRQHSNF